MQTLHVPIRRLTAADIPLPAYFSDGAAGLDLPAAVTDPVVLAAGEYRLIPCGFSLGLPPGVEAQIRPRSGLAHRHGVTVLNAPGTIDSDYRGEVQVLLINHSRESFTVTRGLRIAQLVVARVAMVSWQEVESLPPTTREAGGFGHTGA